jgi:hypothetical protein
MRLFLSFAEEETLENEINNIKDVIGNGKVFVLETPDQYALTFQYGGRVRLHNVFSINRNKSTNTLFTINALNYLIKSVNNGVVDTSISIQWEMYRSSILLVKDGYLQELPTKLYSIID